jgi:hypothetical protein
MVEETSKRKRSPFLPLLLMLTILLGTHPCGATSSIFKANVRHLPYPARLEELDWMTVGTSLIDGIGRQYFYFSQCPSPS